IEEKFTSSDSRKVYQQGNNSAYHYMKVVEGCLENNNLEAHTISKQLMVNTKNQCIFIELSYWNGRCKKLLG
ncbi:unnamed protein product, partial [Brassica oleracea]